LTGGTGIRGCIYNAIFGASASPADNAVLWYAQRYTAAGTATSVTPSALDSGGDPASTCTSGQNHTVEPTYTAGAILFHLALNQRASFNWITDPFRPISIPATANNGIGWYPVNSSFTGNVDITNHFYE
jgi:hypothetical protein